MRVWAGPVGVWPRMSPMAMRVLCSWREYIYAEYLSFYGYVCVFFFWENVRLFVWDDTFVLLSFSFNACILSLCIIHEDIFQC